MRQGLFILFVIGVSCTSKELVPVSVVSDYFPMKKGAYKIYRVDSVVVNQNREVKYTYDLKTEVTDSFPGSNGGFTYLIQRSKRITSSSPWTALESWSARVNAFQAVVNEGNISFVKMEGPLGNGKTWNGNAFNILGGNEKCLDGNAYTCDNYTIGSFAKPYETISGKNFENTLSVIQNDNQDLIVSLDKRSEIYAKKTGLIYREIIKLNYCTDPNCLGTQFVQTGLKYKQTIGDYGGL